MRDFQCVDKWCTLRKNAIWRTSARILKIQVVKKIQNNNVTAILDTITKKMKGKSVMKNKYEFFIAGRARNKDNILRICDLFDKYNISYYCFLKNEDDWGYGNKNQTAEEKQKEFES